MLTMILLKKALCQVDSAKPTTIKAKPKQKQQTTEHRDHPVSGHPHRRRRSHPPGERKHGNRSRGSRPPPNNDRRN